MCLTQTNERSINERPVLFIRAHMPSMAGYSYGNSFDVLIKPKLNTNPNLTPNPIRTHDCAPNPNRPTSGKKTLRPVGVELVT